MVDRATVAAVLDRIVPADEWPAVSDAGLFDHLDQLRADPETSGLADEVDRAIVVVDAAAEERHGRGAARCEPRQLDELIESLDHTDRRTLVDTAAAAFYGDRIGVGSRMVGFRPEGSRPPGAAVAEPTLAAIRLSDLADDERWDVVVLGAGAGGGVAACVAAEAGARVLVVDREVVRAEKDVGRDHLRNHRSLVLGHNTGPGAGNPRELVGPDGVVRVVERAWAPAWHNNAMVVGGGTRVYQGMAWRMLPDDFRMASAYGVPDGSSLADWPISYDELESHYDWIEWEVGACGDGAAHPRAGRRRRGYPMPPLPTNTEAGVLTGGAETLGLATGPVPLLLNSVPRAGRAQCVRCGECVGFACVSDAKNGTHNTVLPRAELAGATLVTLARAARITTDASGRVDGVELVDEDAGSSTRVRAGHVVVACGAIESARLLLTSRSRQHPDGLGNHADQVGRHLQGHGFASAFGRFDAEVIDPDGPGVSIATLDAAHGNVDDDGGELVGGGVVANEIVKLPIVFWNWAYPPDAPRWGAAAKAEMRDAYRRTGHLFCQVQEVPRAENRVVLSDRLDRLGLPVVRLAGHAHAETLRTGAHLGDLAARWLEASGARRVWTDPMPTGLLAGQHQAGTARMGSDPATSVTDPTGRVHGHDNLWIADASVHVTNGSVNPSLTVMALARRTASELIAS